MIKKITFLSLSILFGSMLLYAQVPPAPTLGPGEVWTNLWSRVYDYQTNGSIRYIVQDPNNPLRLCAILMSQTDSSNAPGGTGRFVYFSYSANGGLTWSAVQGNVTGTGATSPGFPSLNIRTTNNGTSYVPIVALHHTGPKTHVYQDSPWGNFSFTEVGTLPTDTVEVLWPHVAGTTNGNIVYVGAPTTTSPGVTFQGYYSYWNGTAWSLPSAGPLPNIGGPSGNFSVEAGPGGRVSVFGIDYNGDGANHWWLSTNNGATFANQTNMPAFIIDPPENDTLFSYIDGGKQGVWVGTEPHFVFAVYSDRALSLTGNYIYFPKARIYHWSPSTGLTVVAGRVNLPNMADTIATALMTPVCQPTIGRTPRGTLVCAFTVFLRGNNYKQVVRNGDTLNTGEIFYNYSTNNGASWSTPVNVTNNPGIEEKHPSFVRYMNYGQNGSLDSVRLYYIRDMLAGGCVNVAGWGKAPVYGLYNRGTGALTPVPIGIREEIQIVRHYELFQNYPNPFNPTTTISYYIQKAGHVILKLYNVMGQEVRTLVDKDQKVGPYEITFDGSGLASGIYYYTISAGDFRDTKKMVLIK